MKKKWIIGPLGVMLTLAPMAFSQDAPTAEAKRQGSVAMKPNAQSPAQSMSQAVAFERYKELAAEREARKEGMTNSGADRSVEKPAKPVKAPKQ
jgi:hypothetical protein